MSEIFEPLLHFRSPLSPSSMPIVPIFSVANYHFRTLTLSYIMLKYVGVLLTFEQFAELANNVLERNYTPSFLLNERVFTIVAYEVEAKLPDELKKCWFLWMAFPSSSQREEDQRAMFICNEYKTEETTENFRQVPYETRNSNVINWLIRHGMDKRHMIQQWETVPELDMVETT